MLYRLKFYVAAVYLPVLIGYTVSELLSKNKGYVFITSFIVLVSLATLVHPHLSCSSILNQLYLNMVRTISNSEDGKYLVLSFDGSVLSFLKSIPIAFGSLIRPFLWEVKGDLLFGLSLLKLDLLIGIVLALVWFKKVAYEAMLILFFSSIMIVLLTIASPNFGTLSRYSVSFLPFLMIVLLIPIVSFFEKEKV